MPATSRGPGRALARLSARRGRQVALALSLALASACATPVGVSRMDARTVQRELTESALTTGTPSAPTRELLTRLALRERFDDDPGGTLAELHAGLAADGDADDRLYALAELSFLRAVKTHDRERGLAAAVYAYAFLFDRAPGAPRLGPFDPRVQVARNVYNLALALAFASEDRQEVVLEGGPRTLPFGALEVSLDPGELRWAGYRLEHFAPAAVFHVRGLNNRYRITGIGAPLAGSLGAPADGALPPGADHIPPRLKVPATALLRLERPRASLASGRLRGTLELYTDEKASSVELAGRSVPLESEKSSSLAYMLEGAPIYDFGVAGFRLGDFLPGGVGERIVFLQPYRPGRIPVVLVHGTFSSPATWAQLVNELQNDPVLSQRIQLWLFLYNSGNPIAYSAGILTETLRETVAALDPAGRDAALRRMVVIGHSQGGLLTKLTAVESGDRFWRNVTSRPFDETRLPPETRQLLERSLFYHPLPFVERVIFMSTPHRGSYLSEFSLAGWVSRLVKLPLRITQATASLAILGRDAKVAQALARPPTSLDNMRPGSPFLVALSGLPVAPRIRAHSVIAVLGDGPLEHEGDGVVRYPSAHLDGVASELVVRHSGHSVQENPLGIEEVRRILREHVATGAAQAP